MVESRWAMTKLVRFVHDLDQGLLNLVFGFGVDVGGGFVQHEHGRVSQDRAGQGDSLLLAA